MLRRLSTVGSSKISLVSAIFLNDVLFLPIGLASFLIGASTTCISEEVKNDPLEAASLKAFDSNPLNDYPQARSCVTEQFSIE